MRTTVAVKAVGGGEFIPSRWLTIMPRAVRTRFLGTQYGRPSDEGEARDVARLL